MFSFASSLMAPKVKALLLSFCKNKCTVNLIFTPWWLFNRITWLYWLIISSFKCYLITFFFRITLQGSMGVAQIVHTLCLSTPTSSTFSLQRAMCLHHLSLTPGEPWPLLLQGIMVSFKRSFSQQISTGFKWFYILPITGLPMCLMLDMVVTAPVCWSVILPISPQSTLTLLLKRSGGQRHYCR